jgi:hypothetical protein
VNPKFQIDETNKSSSPKQRLNEITENHNNTQQMNQTDIDDDTKCLMMFHEQIIPSPTLVSEKSRGDFLPVANLFEMLIQKTLVEARFYCYG